MSLLLAPFVIIIIMIFADESEIPATYGFRNSDLVYYLLFGLCIAPFQVMMDILMNHATEIAHGVKISDYMVYAMWRWDNRLTRWLFDDPRFDMSISESVQSINHLCFSPQFYFIVSYYSWGIILMILAYTMLLRAVFNPFADPFFLFLIISQFLLNRILDWVVRFITFKLIWKPKSNVADVAFARDMYKAMKWTHAYHAEQNWKDHFFQKHTAELLNALPSLMTPRTLRKSKHYLIDIYDKALNLQQKWTYETPLNVEEVMQEKPDLTAIIEDESDEEMYGMAPEEFTRKVRVEREQRASKLAIERAMISTPEDDLRRLDQDKGEKSKDWPLSDKHDKPSNFAGMPLFPRAIMQAWYETAHRRLLLQKCAQNWGMEQVPLVFCETCGIHSRDHRAYQDTGIWGSDGPQLMVHESMSIVEVCRRYEQDDDVNARMGKHINERRWRKFLDDAYYWRTLCWRCSQLLDCTALHLPYQPSEGSSSARFSDDSSVEWSTDNELEELFPEHRDLKVSKTTQMILLRWARRAQDNLLREQERLSGGPPPPPLEFVTPLSSVRPSPRREMVHRGTPRVTAPFQSFDD